MIRTQAFLGLPLLCLPAMAVAQMGNAALGIDDAPVKAEILVHCAFDTECFDGEGCAQTTFEASLTGRAGGLSTDTMTAQTKLSTVSGNVEMIGVKTPDAMALAGGSLDARHMLTTGANGAARYTVHYADGPMAITYLGQCQ